MVSGWGILNFTARVKSGAFCPSVKAIATSLSGKSPPSQNSIHHDRGTLLQAEPTRQERAGRQRGETETERGGAGSVSVSGLCLFALPSPVPEQPARGGVRAFAVFEGHFAID